MTYRRRASPLHAARATVGAAWCLAVVVVALSIRHPLVLAALLGAVLLAGVGACVGRVVARAAMWASLFGLLIVLVNALVVREGLTVVWRLGGSWDVTLEAIVTGAVYGLTAVVLFAVAALHSAAVDPDDLLRAFRRVSPRSALAAALATRMVPVLARDARRIADAQRCTGRPAPKLALVRAVASNAIDRSLDVAATLEVRGYGLAPPAASGARRWPRSRGAAAGGAAARRWSRHDLAFAASAVALVALAIGAPAPFDAYPRLIVPLDAGVVVTAVAAVLCVLLPFADRRGIGR